MKGRVFDIAIEDRYIFNIEVAQYSKGYMGRCWGAWEDCYPDEPEEIEYRTLGCSAIDEDGEVVELSINEAESLAEKLEDIVTEKLLEEIRDYGDDY